MNKKSPISTDAEWTFELIERYELEIGRIAANFKLDTYPNQIEIINSEQMMDAYASVGMPLHYNHWSYGKRFLDTSQNYQRGRMGLAYEIVINSDPCIAYLMEENTMMMQALVIAHACYGHNSFFKGNYLFRTWTDASAIIDYLVFAKNYIAKCEERHGIDAVEAMLDSCHSLMNFGVNRYIRPPVLTPDQESKKVAEREEYIQRHINTLWTTVTVKEPTDTEKQINFPQDPEENLLYFIEKNAPLLEPWQREIIRIVRKMAQYFYPQKQTQVMNEGWACFWHYTLLHQMYEEGLVTEGFMMEFLQSHTSVIYQPPFDSPYFSGINPYTLGFNMMIDIKRICQEPTAEDRVWFPDIAGSPWLDTVHYVMKNFKDESFIRQYLSPRLMRELKLFSILDNSDKPTLKVSAIHNETGYKQVRNDLANQYDLGYLEPNIQIYNVEVRGDRSLTLRHYVHQQRPLGESVSAVLRHLHQLWGFDIHLESVTAKGEILNTYHFPEVRPKSL
ncbi:MAG: SpoVR family protein [Pseudomonadales bacterium]|nr:SpoVR family protein [Pseudomonadales bacterium]NRA16288.1 SpoVR family protein [Oceanospirillaceae bacterium]